MLFLFQSLLPSVILIPSLSVFPPSSSSSFSLSHTRTHIFASKPLPPLLYQTLILIVSVRPSNSLTLFLSSLIYLSLSFSLTLSLTLTHIITLIITQTDRHTHTHTHKISLTHTLSLSYLSWPSTSPAYLTKKSVISLMETASNTVAGLNSFDHTSTPDRLITSSSSPSSSSSSVTGDVDVVAVADFC